MHCRLRPLNAATGCTRTMELTLQTNQFKVLPNGSVWLSPTLVHRISNVATMVSRSDSSGSRGAAALGDSGDVNFSDLARQLTGKRVADGVESCRAARPMRRKRNSGVVPQARVAQKLCVLTSLPFELLTQVLRHVPSRGLGRLSPSHRVLGAWVGQWKLRKANMTPSPQELARIETEYQKWLGKGAYLHVEMSYPAIEKRITIEEATSKLELGLEAIGARHGRTSTEIRRFVGIDHPSVEGWRSVPGSKESDGLNSLNLIDWDPAPTHPLVIKLVGLYQLEASIRKRCLIAVRPETEQEDAPVSCLRTSPYPRLEYARAARPHAPRPTHDRHRRRNIQART
mmetsp:Transcript_6350/g.16071  ORF Transcript_6350/g.16071 Transcript_6350/m.16071 type:complete len:342 (-) Transcript_6350:405-1430(-)